MSWLRALLGFSLVGQIALAVWLWPRLPDRVPTHFGLDGSPDAWGVPGTEWFVTSGLMAALGAAVGYALPPFIRRLASKNSSLLNVPDRERFGALPPQARVRAVSGMEGCLLAIGIELQALTAFLLGGTALVANGTWARLPPAGIYAALALLLGTSIALVITGSRRVRREIASAR